MTMFASLIALSIGVGVAAFVAVMFAIRGKVQRHGVFENRAGLFQYHDGVKVRYGDPMHILMDLQNNPDYDMRVHPKQVELGLESAIKVQSSAVKKAFGVEDFTEPGKPGLTIQEQNDLLYTFWYYVDAQKKNTSPSPTSAHPTEQTSSNSESTTTKSISGSGSIETEPLPG